MQKQRTFFLLFILHVISIHSASQDQSYVGALTRYIATQCGSAHFQRDAGYSVHERLARRNQAKVAFDKEHNMVHETLIPLYAKEQCKEVWQAFERASAASPDSDRTLQLYEMFRDCLARQEEDFMDAKYTLQYAQAFIEFRERKFQEFLKENNA